MSEATVSQDVLAAAKRLAERQQLGGASMADIAKEAGITRVTLYRRGETRAAILVALRDELAREERERLLPVLAGPGDARTRLTAAFEVFCAITDERADLMAGLDDPTLNAIYHDPGDDSLTRTEFTAPIVRLLRDGALDGSLRPFTDPDETATVLYVQVCETYRHLRREHRWPAKRATDAVLGLALHGLLP
ncbi:TetR/AcrR family transcriptional regulator [Jiangella alba]|uniref:TetR/AcrR family transcriptional regulator n=1 Tax=Jiangella alba TaxID=561176 RepID=UPI001C0BC41B|nr:TetR/AcrR family transcriptional regulator [Jiangella alba]